MRNSTCSRCGLAVQLVGTTIWVTSNGAVMACGKTALRHRPMEMWEVYADFIQMEQELK